MAKEKCACLGENQEIALEFKKKKNNMGLFYSVLSLATTSKVSFA
jgi:hypothetical protein